MGCANKQNEIGILALALALAMAFGFSSSVCETAFHIPMGCANKQNEIGILDDGQWTMDNGRWTMDNGQWTIDKNALALALALALAMDERKNRHSMPDNGHCLWQQRAYFVLSREAGNEVGN
ncbi:MAG: hypothetical protein IKQ30_11915 [Bacteroidales bacterium]|nr:hypothetical protein [Bacteroidales bacterium]